jgi:predicted nucleic acid-binding protein
MTPYILDTDTLSLLQRGHPKVLQQCRARPHADLAIMVISVEEQLTGRYTRSGKPGIQPIWPWCIKGWRRRFTPWPN